MFFFGNDNNFHHCIVVIPAIFGPESIFITSNYGFPNILPGGTGMMHFIIPISAKIPSNKSQLLYSFLYRTQIIKDEILK